MVPRLWPDSTIVCVGSGPSLTAADIVRCRLAGAKILAINNACLLCAPLPDAIYAPDAQWWGWHPEALAAPCPKFAFQVEARIYPDLTILNRTGYDGLERDPRGLRSGGHSGYAAINLAVHLGARTILLLGYDHGPADDGRHHFSGGDHPDGSHIPFAEIEEGPVANTYIHRDVYDSLVVPLAELEIDVINVSRRSAITAFPVVPLPEVLRAACRV